jgi:hypothetical protein
MNKKIITLVSVAVIAAIFLLWGIGRFVPRQSLIFEVLATSRILEIVALLLAAPVRLYAFFVYHDHGSWSLPVLFLLAALSGLMWGVIVERIVWLFSKRNTAH